MVTSSGTPIRVTILQRRLTHYRVLLFEAMRSRLQNCGVELQIVHGQPAPDELDKNDSGSLPWAAVIDNQYVKLGGKYLCWQPAASKLRGSRLVVIAQENSLLSNVPWLLKPPSMPPRIAFWGHGANLQSRSRNGPSERLKRWTSKRVFWWFAYTELSAALVARDGFDRSRITVLNNAIDTSELCRLRESISAAQARSLRSELDLGDGPVALFLGSLYQDKRMEFLIAAARSVRDAVPGFALLIIGDGPERHRIQDYAKRLNWVRWVGAMRGSEKVRYASICQLMMNPGSVGLNVLDAFGLGIPIVTTEWRFHGPEIAYLENGVNGLITADDPGAYAKEVAGLLQNREKLGALRAGCLSSARQYTLHAMAERFSDGILEALAAARGTSPVSPHAREPERSRSSDITS